MTVEEATAPPRVTFAPPRVAFRVLVTGGRDLTDIAMVHEALDRARKRWGDFAVVHGGATGADRIASKWAADNALPREEFCAEWRKYGRSAGVIRNQDMVNSRPDLVLAFPGGVGTEDCVKRAARAGLRVFRVARRVVMEEV